MFVCLLQSISWIGNTFGNIQTRGLTCRTKNFLFTDNNVEEISNEGFDVSATKIEIVKNKFNHLDTRALETISFSYGAFLNYDLAVQFLYKFSDNRIQMINPGSLHPNWAGIRNLCGVITVENNVFNCSCSNFGWMSILHGVGPKISKHVEFYTKYIVTNKNTCEENKNCSIQSLSNILTSYCSNKTSLVCNGFENNHVNESSSSSSSATSSSTTYRTKTTQSTRIDKTTTEIKKSLANTDFVTVEEKKYFNNDTEKQHRHDVMILQKEVQAPLTSYKENGISHSYNEHKKLWFVIGPLLAILIVTYVGIFKWFYGKKRKSQTMAKMYKNTQDHGDDDDDDDNHVIVINEHINQLTDEMTSQT